jgi:voltage-gated potassium channel
MLSALRRVIHDDDTRAGRAFDLVVQWLIVVSLVASAVDTLPSLSDQAHAAFRTFERATLVAFTVEYLARLVTAPRPLRFARSFFGLVDLAAVVPFWLGTGLDLRAVRAFRLLRLVRLLKLLRYSRALMRYRLAFGAIKAELTLYLLASFLVVYVASVGIYQFEHAAQPEAFASVFDSMWWAVATLTTVGYGDVYPVTAGGRAFTVLILVVGLGVVVVPTALV